MRVVPPDQRQVLLHHQLLDLQLAHGGLVPVEARVPTREGVRNRQVVRVNVPRSAEIAAHLVARQMAVEVHQQDGRAADRHQKRLNLADRRERDRLDQGVGIAGRNRSKVSLLCVPTETSLKSTHDSLKNVPVADRVVLDDVPSHRRWLHRRLVLFGVLNNFH